jgi:hypothetical protein
MVLVKGARRYYAVPCRSRSRTGREKMRSKWLACEGLHVDCGVKTIWSICGVVAHGVQNGLSSEP